jgi:hypothetical protein
MGCCCCVVGVMCMARHWQMHMALPDTETGAGSGTQHLAVCRQGAISMAQCLWAPGYTYQGEQWVAEGW